jgi:hypothetical protein
MNPTVIALILTSALTAFALPQNATVTSSADLDAINSIISALNSYAYASATPTDSVTRTAEGYVSVDSATPTFTDINARFTTAATQTVIISELDMVITQYINPIQSVSPNKIKRDLLQRGQPIDVCPCPTTVTVIEWVDCEATPVPCDICPTKKSCDCEEGFIWVIPTSTIDPCTTTWDPCLLYVIGKDGQNDYPPGQTPPPGPPPPPPAVKPRDQGYAYSGTIIVSVSSQLAVSTGFPLMSDWSSLLTWPAATTSSLPITCMITVP